MHSSLDKELFFFSHAKPFIKLEDICKCLEKWGFFVLLFFLNLCLEKTKDSDTVSKKCMPATESIRWGTRSVKRDKLISRELSEIVMPFSFS